MPVFDWWRDYSLRTMVEEEGFRFGLCPSFSCYSVDGISEAVTRVIGDSGGFHDFDHCSVSGKDHSLISEEINEECQKEDDFEFVLLRGHEHAFPIFNHGVLENRLERELIDREDSPTIRISLEQLILGDRDPPSSSSSEADEMDEIPPETYCLRTPRTEAVAEGRCKKSKSTGSSSSPSKRWRLRDLLRRSNSDGKSSAVFFTSRSNSTKNGEKDDKLEQSEATKSSAESKTPVKLNGKGASAHAAFYVHNIRQKEELKKKSYLPYKQDLLGSVSTSTPLASHFHTSKL